MANLRSFDSFALIVTEMKITALILATLGLAYAAPSVDQPKVEVPYPFHPRTGGRIVGGVVASIKDLPWQVALLRNGALICGGAIIGPKVVLTAAHCVVPSVIPSVSQLNIRAGSNLHNSGGLRVAVSQIIIHPLYKDCLTCAPDYDIAVLHLASNIITHGTPTDAIRMYESNAMFHAGTTATVSGWGATRENGSGSVQLRRVDVPVVTKANCRATYGSIITERTICAGTAAGGKDACQGDSGGPFVINNKLAGVVSFGSGCARPGVPGVYSSIPGYRAWIRSNAGI
ncbi:unnamed protein product [Ceutorhynchus assimilis]|uniref:Peptidase S1 domain-containing protein n=1 Tax=Ceutorhynchus assimilis TaxID=467358 RepID=A0A9N9MM08_9CUCU|nr:unnamed protein product [Ceutorhynchus assimilis]